MYTVIEAAAELKLDPSYIRFLIRSGKLQGVKWGRDWMIPVLDYSRKQGCKKNTHPASGANPYNQAVSDKMDVFHLFRETPIFEGVNPSELMILAENSVRLHFDKHQTIVMEEDRAEFCYFTLNGLLKITKTSPSGREIIIDVLVRGGMFGIASIVRGYIFPDEVHAIEDTDIVSIPKNIFVAFASRNPGVMTKIVEFVMVKMAALYTRLIDLSTDKASNRVIKVLHELRRKFGDILPFTHKEIAEMSGTTTETASRILINLKKRGALRLRRGNIQVMDATRLSL
jgi:CRP-like cAMP-binding protein